MRTCAGHAVIYLATKTSRARAAPDVGGFLSGSPLYHYGGIIIVDESIFTQSYRA